MYYLLTVLSVPALIVVGLIMVVIHGRVRCQQAECKFERTLMSLETMEHNYEVLVEEIIEPDGSLAAALSHLASLANYVASLAETPENRQARTDACRVERHLTVILSHVTGRNRWRKL